jgi:hypothetical protein
MEEQQFFMRKTKAGLVNDGIRRIVNATDQRQEMPAHHLDLGPMPKHGRKVFRTMALAAETFQRATDQLAGKACDQDARRFTVIAAQRPM